MFLFEYFIVIMFGQLLYILTKFYKMLELYFINFSQIWKLKLVVNLQITKFLRGQFFNCEKLRGRFVISKQIGVNLQFFENLLGSIWKFIRMRKFGILSF